MSWWIPNIQKSRPSVLQRCLCSGSHVVVATCPTGHPLYKQLRCVARHDLPEGLRICYAGDLCNQSNGIFWSWGEGERFLLVFERWRTKPVWQQEREECWFFFVVMVEQGLFVWFNHFGTFCFTVFGQAGLDFVWGGLWGVVSLMISKRNPTYHNFGISISTPTVLEFLQIQIPSSEIKWIMYLHVIYMCIYTHKYVVFSPNCENNLERPWQLSSFFNDSFAPYPLSLQISRDWESIFAGLVLTAEVSAAPQ